MDVWTSCISSVDSQMLKRMMLMQDALSPSSSEAFPLLDCVCVSAGVAASKNIKAREKTKGYGGIEHEMVRNRFLFLAHVSPSTSPAYQKEVK